MVRLPISGCILENETVMHSGSDGVVTCSLIEDYLSVANYVVEHGLFANRPQAPIFASIGFFLQNAIRDAEYRYASHDRSLSHLYALIRDVDALIVSSLIWRTYLVGGSKKTSQKNLKRVFGNNAGAILAFRTYRSYILAHSLDTKTSVSNVPDRLLEDVLVKPFGLYGVMHPECKSADYVLKFFVTATGEVEYDCFVLSTVFEPVFAAMSDLLRSIRLCLEKRGEVLDENRS